VRLIYDDSLFSRGSFWLCAIGVIALHEEQSTQAAKGCNSAAGVQTWGCLKSLVTEILDFL